MEPTQQVVAMPASQRAELKRLALAVADEVSRNTFSSVVRGAFRAALSPAVVLDTLTYVEALEARLSFSLAPERLTHIRQEIEELPRRVARRTVRPSTGEDWSDYAVELLSHAEAAEARAATLEAQVRELQAGAGKWQQAAQNLLLWWTEGGYVGAKSVDFIPQSDQVDAITEFKQAVRALLPASAAPQQPTQPAPQGGGWVGQVPGMPQAQCHGCGLPEHVARCRKATCPMKEEVIGRYETSGLPVYEGDDYVTDVEGCYLTRAEAEELRREAGNG